MASDYTEEFHEMMLGLMTTESTAGLTNTSTVSNADGYKRPTLDDMIEALARFKVEPFGDAMRKQGCSPEDGWILVLPQSRCQPGAPLPPYVRVSEFLRDVVLMNTRRCGIEPFPQPYVPEDPQ
jgi:hypothetical protein